MAGFFSKFWWEVKVLLGALLLSLLILTMLLLSVPIKMYRKSLELFVRFFREDLNEILLPGSSFLAHDELYTVPKFNIITCIYLEGQTSLEILLSKFQEMLTSKNKDGELEYRHFKQFWVPFGGYLFWRTDPNFELRNHVRCYDYLNRSGSTEARMREEEAVEMQRGSVELSKPCTEADLQTALSTLISLPWTKDQSPWEALIVNDFVKEEGGRNNRKTSALLIRVNHGLGDGYSLLKILVDKLAGVETPVPQRPRRTWGQSLLETVTLPFLIPYQLSERVLELSPDVNAWRLADSQMSDLKYVVWTKGIPIGLIKQIKNRFQVNFQAVLNSIVAGGIRRLMEAEAQTVPAKMLAFMPFPMYGHPGGLSIHLAFALIEFLIGETDPIKRLKAAHAEYIKVRQSTVLLTNFKGINFIGSLPSCLVRRCRNRLNTLAVSSFPGPDDDLGSSIAGNRGTDVVFCVGPWKGNTGAVFCELTCCGKLRISATIERNLVSSYEAFQKLPDYIQDELNLLLDRKVDA